MFWTAVALGLLAYDDTGAIVAACDEVEIHIAADTAEVREIENCRNIGDSPEPPPVQPPPTHGNLCLDQAAANGWNCLAFEGLEDGTGVTGSNVIGQQETVSGAANRTHVYAVPAGPDSNTNGSVKIVPGDGTFKSFAMAEFPRTITGNQPAGSCEGWGSTGEIRWRIDEGGGCSELGYSSGFVYWLIGSSTPGHGFTYKVQYAAGQ